MISLAASIVTMSEDLEVDTNYTRNSIMRSDPNVTVFNHNYTNKAFRDEINRYNSNPRFGRPSDDELDDGLKLLEEI